MLRAIFLFLFGLCTLPVAAFLTCLNAEHSPSILSTSSDMLRYAKLTV